MGERGEEARRERERVGEEESSRTPLYVFVHVCEIGSLSHSKHTH